MRDWNVHLTRLHILQYVGRLRGYISSLPDSEPDAYAKLIGAEGANTGARIADFVLQELGHTPPAAGVTSPTIRAAKEVLGRVHGNSKGGGRGDIGPTGAVK